MPVSVLELEDLYYPLTCPFFEYTDDIPNILPSPEPVWKETAYTGTFQYSEATKKYFLITTASETITLEVPETVKMESLVGKRILAIGSYNKSSRTLIVKDTKDMEVLAKSPAPVPVTSPTPAPAESLTPSPSESPAAI